jgi:NAD(P)-dependent dehydrogenase (short-subunit alcohol dehydrogenase family)
VTVNTVTPGIILGEGLIRWGRETPAGRLGTAKDVALVTCMLASPRSGFVTGSNHRVDGGQIRSVI